MKTIRKRSTKKEEEGKKEEEEVLTGALLSHVENAGDWYQIFKRAVSIAGFGHEKQKRENPRKPPPFANCCPFFSLLGFRFSRL